MEIDPSERGTVEYVVHTPRIHMLIAHPCPGFPALAYALSYARSFSRRFCLFLPPPRVVMPHLRG
jgi:orotidine-5'-phosphate decarboxylase